MVVTLPPLRRTETPRSEKWRLVVGIGLTVSGLIVLVVGIAGWLSSSHGPWLVCGATGGGLLVRRILERSE